ncbi:P1 family peptidase [Variovorax sp. OV329]|uniref:DmpA family aminopeptidase n=1 Tax=Variovorax sp. OV329 TaxID=1882825 RepID=UPI0008E6698B|nr:P1 family peptidase [Variovorax sp. OV329]SFM31176.1 L-aminopeptidase DmpA. Serine peptidase. MEROPS family S58 [Variovorax sp. OV329]
MHPLPPRIGALPSGPRDAITDLAGVSVGHATLSDGAVQTGVTVVRPHAGDPYLQRVPAGVSVINGFGKSVGLVQVEELGVLETPIALTNTFSVPEVARAQIRQCVAANPECGRGLPTVNPLVFECNDGYLNDIQRMAVREADYLAAWSAAGEPVAQGAVGAGRGMSCFGLKGGIGTASRRVEGQGFTVGALVLANFGRLPQLVLAGRPVGRELAARLDAGSAGPEKGSIIVLVATDASLDARQLGRLAVRAGAGIARTGSVFGHGSGDIALAFSTAYTVPLSPDVPMPAVAMLHDARLDGLFQAVADGVEQAIVHALWHAEPVAGRDGHARQALRDLLADAAVPTNDKPT